MFGEWDTGQLLPERTTLSRSRTYGHSRTGCPDIRITLTLRFRLTGQSGTGRTTFVNTLCESDVLAHKTLPSPEQAHIEDGIKIQPVNVGECLSEGRQPGR